MATQDEIEQLKAELELARAELAMLEASAGTETRGIETRKRIKKAKAHEEAILAKLAKLGVKP